MKKSVLLMSGIVLCIALSACGSNSDSESSTSNTAVSENNTNTTPETSVPENTTPESSVPENTAPESTPTDDGAAVSENLFDNQFSFHGTVITMPAAIKDFGALGFTVSADKAEYTLNPRSFTSGSIVNSDESKMIFVGLYNLGSDAIKYGDAKLSSVNFKSTYFDNSEIVFAKGIQLGATMEEVKAAYGEPTDFYDDDSSYSSLKYENPDESRNFYQFSFKDKILDGVELYVDKQ